MPFTSLTWFSLLSRFLFFFVLVSSHIFLKDSSASFQSFLFFALVCFSPLSVYWTSTVYHHWSLSCFSFSSQYLPLPLKLYLLSLSSFSLFHAPSLPKCTCMLIVSWLNWYWNVSIMAPSALEWDMVGMAEIWIIIRPTIADDKTIDNHQDSLVETIWEA